MGRKSLFRHEALRKSNSALGGILIAAPVSRWLQCVLALSAGLALLLFLFFGHYTRREAVAGQLVPNEGLLNINAPAAGVMTRLVVHDGQTVRRGDVLLELTSEQDSATVGQTHAVVSQSLDAQKARLRSDLENQQVVSLQQTSALRAKLDVLRLESAQIAEQMRLQEKQVAGNQDLLERIRPLGAKGYASIVQIQQQESAVLEAQAQYKNLARQQLDARQQIDAASQQLAQIPLDDLSKRNETERQLASVAQSLAQNEMQRAVVIRAPSDGIIANELLQPGQTVAAGQPMVSILPAGSVLEAQLLVPSRGVGFIEPGNQVVLRYQAFPYQKFGQKYGRIVQISRSALSATEVAELAGQQTQEPLYRVMVTLDQQQVMVYGKPEALRPGMAIEADILMERRRLIEWVFEPLYGIGHHLGGGGRG